MPPLDQREGSMSSSSSSATTTKLRIRLHATGLPRQKVRGSLRKIPPSAYGVVTSVDRLNQADVWGSTETLEQAEHPQWTQTVTVDYEYGAEKFFYVHVFHHSEQTDQAESEVTEPAAFRLLRRASTNVNVVTLGTALFEIGDILGSQRQTKVKRLRCGGCVLCRIEPVAANSNNRLVFHLGMAVPLLMPGDYRRVQMFQNDPDTIIEISRREDLDRPWMTVWRSQPVLNSLQPTWDRAQVDMGVICNDNTDDALLLTVSYIQKGRKFPIGQSETTVANLLKLGDRNDGNSILFLQRSDTKAKIVGKINVKLAHVIGGEQSETESTLIVPVDVLPILDLNRPADYIVDLASLSPVAAPKSFKHYVDRGCEIDFRVAIDFTSSNGDPRLPESYHYQGDGTMNDYAETILTVGEALAAYNKSKEYVVWGFGAKFGGKVRHIFQCGPDPVVHGVDGILSAYQSMFQSDLTMSGPTEFLQVLQAAASQANKQHEDMKAGGSLRYMVLLVITDGVMYNEEETRRKLEVYEGLPLHIIFVGVGRSSFDSLQNLCSNRKTKFVDFRGNQHDPTALGQAALCELPKHLCSYMQAQGL